MSDVASLGLAVDSSPVVAATRALDEMGNAASRVPGRVSQIATVTDLLVAALNRNTTATDALSTKITALDAANLKAASSTAQVSKTAGEAASNVIKFTGATTQAAAATNASTDSVNRSAGAWRNLANEAGQALKAIEAARRVQAAPPPPPVAPPAPPAAPPPPPPTPPTPGYAPNVAPWGYAPATGPTGPRIPLGGAQNRDGRLNAFQAQNLFYQGTDVVASLASGISPMTIALQQGGQIAPTFMGRDGATLPGILRQTTEAAGGLISRYGMLVGTVGGVTATIATGAAAWLSYRSSVSEAEKALTGVGRASGVTLTQLNAVAERAAGNGMSTGQAREIGSIYAGQGRVGAGMLGAAISQNRDLAGFLGVDQTEAAGTLAAAMADVSRGADSLASKYGLLSATQVESIQRMDAQGDRLGAQRALLLAVGEATRGLSEDMTGWARVTGLLATGWDALGQRIDRVVTGGSLDDRLDSARQRLEAAQAAAEGGLGLFTSRDVEVAQREYDRLASRARDRDRAATDVQRNRASAQVDAILRSVNPSNEAIKRLEDQATALRQPFRENWIDPYGEAKRAIDGIAAQTKQMREDLAQGGANFADSMRSIDFQRRNVGVTGAPLSSAQIDEEAANKRLQALRGAGSDTDMLGFERQMQNIEAERVARQNLLREQTIYDGGAGGGRYSRTLAQVPAQYRDLYYQAGTRYGVNPDLLAAQGYQESRFNPNARSPVGAEGIAQFMPETARAYGLRDPRDPAAAIDAQARLMRDLLREYNGDEASALVGYNASTAVRRRFQASGRDVSVLPAETRGYVNSILRGGETTQAQVQEQEARARTLRDETNELRINEEARGRSTEATRASVEVMRSVSEAQARGRTVSEALTVQFREEATARERLRTAGQFLQFSANDNFTRDQLGRTRSEQQTFAVARPFEGSSRYEDVLNRSRETASLIETKTMLTDGATSFVTALRRGEGAADALANVFGNVADRLLSKVVDSAVSGLFSGGGGGGGGGPLGFLSGLFGGGGSSPTGGVRLFSGGGYTGPGGRDVPAGLVHRGEVVWSQSDVARYGGPHVVERMRLGYAGYAGGGVVGDVGMYAQGSGNGQQGGLYAPISVTMEGSSGDPAMDRAHAEQAASAMRAEMERVYQSLKHRDMRPNGDFWKAGLRRAG